MLKMFSSKKSKADRAGRAPSPIGLFGKLKHWMEGRDETPDNSTADECRDCLAVQKYYNGSGSQGRPVLCRACKIRASNPVHTLQDSNDDELVMNIAVRAGSASAQESQNRRHLVTPAVPSSNLEWDRRANDAWGPERVRRANAPQESPILHHPRPIRPFKMLVVKTPSPPPLPTEVTESDAESRASTGPSTAPHEPSPPPVIQAAGSHTAVVVNPNHRRQSVKPEQGHVTPVARVEIPRSGHGSQLGTRDTGRRQSQEAKNSQPLSTTNSSGRRLSVVPEVPRGGRNNYLGPPPSASGTSSNNQPTPSSFYEDSARRRNGNRHQAIPSNRFSRMGIPIGEDPVGQPGLVRKALLGSPKHTHRNGDPKPGKKRESEPSYQNRRLSLVETRYERVLPSPEPAPTVSATAPAESSRWLHKRQPSVEASKPPSGPSRLPSEAPPRQRNEGQPSVETSKPPVAPSRQAPPAPSRQPPATSRQPPPARPRQWAEIQQLVEASKPQQAPARRIIKGKALRPLSLIHRDKDGFFPLSGPNSPDERQISRTPIPARRQSARTQPRQTGEAGFQDRQGSRAPARQQRPEGQCLQERKISNIASTTRKQLPGQPKQVRSALPKNAEAAKKALPPFPPPSPPYTPPSNPQNPNRKPPLSSRAYCKEGMGADTPPLFSNVPESIEITVPPAPHMIPRRAGRQQERASPSRIGQEWA
ncbi:MAG: hypothetical protein M1829_000753 [Trizodia sp. TS-e1964]|nr:MAG: hypothetical protein M1829_000753 [Trizodia sp. TS-e1964]